MLGDLLDGSEYLGAYGSMDTAKSEISREIERQRQIISATLVEVRDIGNNLLWMPSCV